MSKRFYSKKSEKLAHDASDACQAGTELTDLHAVRRMEEQLRQDHTNVITRCMLVGYYSEGKSPDASEKWCSHMEWLIKNCSDENLMIYVSNIPESISAEQYEALKELYLQKVKRNPKNANVVGHAAEFIEQSDLKQSFQLYKRAKKLAPNDERWARALCMISIRNASESKDMKRAKVAYKRANKFVRKFENFAHEAYPVLVVLQELCELALEFDDLKMVKILVRELKRSHWNTICPSHHPHHYAGLLALRKGHIKRAKAQLLKAAKKGQDPEIFSSTLASQLQELGELDTVKQYLTLCLANMSAEYQKEEIKLVKQWIERLKKGEKVSLTFPSQD